MEEWREGTMDRAETLPTRVGLTKSVGEKLLSTAVHARFTPAPSCRWRRVCSFATKSNPRPMMRQSPASKFGTSSGRTVACCVVKGGGGFARADLVRATLREDEQWQR
ncbi:hypothetical protein GQ600_7159 [Phytophthora cactorum]|nr:hypothetical protein GQ600_7159 [Phytophthora cactorum]